MSGDLSIVRHLHIWLSPAGKILRHLARLRYRTELARLELARLKALSRIEAHYGLPYFNAEDVEALENSIASSEREMTSLQKALEATVEDYNPK